MHKSLKSLIDLNEKLAGVAGGLVIENGDYILTSTTGKASWFDRLFPLHELDDESFKKAADECRNPEHPMWLTFSTDANPEMASQAEKEGMGLALPSHAGMYYEPAKTFDEDIKVIPIDDSTLVEWDRVRAASFGVPAETTWHSKLIKAEGAFYYGAVVDGSIVSTGYLVVDDAWTNGGIYCIGTPEENRGKGYASAVMKHIMNVAADKKIPLLTLQASAMGRPVYARLGFKDECTIEGWA